MIAFAKVTGSGQITIPVELRRKHNIVTGDRVKIAENLAGQIVISPTNYTAKDLDGIFAPLPGVNIDGDFDDLIAEAFEQGVDRKVAELNDGYDPR